VKRFRVIIALAAILAISAFYLPSGAPGESSQEPLKLTLNEAVEIALRDNPAIGLSELAVQKAELKREQLNYREKKVDEKEEMYGISLKDFDYEYQMELGKKAADMELKLAKLGVEAAKRNIRFAVEAAYYAALSARDKAEIAKDSFERAKEMERIANALYKNGSATKKDVLDAQVKVATQEAELKKAQVDMEKAYIDLKKLLRIDMARPIELTESSEFKAVEKEVSLEELLEKARENRIDLVQAKEQLELARLDFDMTKKVYPENTFQYKEKEYALKQAELNYKDVESKIEQEVRKAYLDYTAASFNIPILEKSLEMAEESYRIAKLSYEAGLIRSVDLSQAQEAVKQVRQQKAAAIYGYNLAALSLDNVIYMSISR
jgi:outer membrane protein TolC